VGGAGVRAAAVRRDGAQRWSCTTRNLMPCKPSWHPITLPCACITGPTLPQAATPGSTAAHLRRHKEPVARQLHNLHARPRVVLAHKPQARRLKLVHQLGVHLVPEGEEGRRGWTGE